MICECIVSTYLHFIVSTYLHFPFFLTVIVIFKYLEALLKNKQQIKMLSNLNLKGKSLFFSDIKTLVLAQNPLTVTNQTLYVLIWQNCANFHWYLMHYTWQNLGCVLALMLIRQIYVPYKKLLFDCIFVGFVLFFIT